METNGQPERGIELAPRPQPVCQRGLERIHARAELQLHNIADKRVDLGVTHDIAGNVGVAGIPGIKLCETAAQALPPIRDCAPGAFVGQWVAFEREAGTGKKEPALGREMRVDGVPLHAGALRDRADTGARGAQFAMQVDRRLNDAAAGIGLIFRAAAKRIAALSTHCTGVYSDIDSRQDINYTALCIQYWAGSAGLLMSGGQTMKASSLSFPAAVVMVLAGMVWGLVMAISQDHSAMPAHAHLNLLGWVSLFLFGIFYHLHPALDRSRAALVQVGLWIVGTVILTIGVALVHTGHGGEPIAAAGSFIVLGAMLLFGWLVVRREQTAKTYRASAVPAE